MRNRIPNGRLALLCVVCLALAGSLPGCGTGDGTYNPILIGGGNTPVPSFTLALTPPSHAITSGGTTTYTATVTSVNGFSSPVTFSITGLPAGATGTFSPTSATPTANGATSTLTLVTTGAPGSLTSTIQSVGKPTRVTTAEGTYTLTVTATGGGISRQSTVTLTITANNNSG
ncbi:MAG: Alkaline phosphatase precursor [Chthonomonadales bacterium]|nr:Alkaline phosphatase precursor [Chthonomonadales bacterium]